MASVIKKFFQKRKLDVKFKKAGEGYKLTEQSSVSSQSSRGGVRAGSAQGGVRVGSAQGGGGGVSKRHVSGEDAQKAGAAALSRIEAIQQKEFNPAAVANRVRIRREIEAENAALEKAEAAARSGPTEVIQDAAPVLSLVLYKCPEIGPLCLPKAEMETHIEEFLLTNLADEPEMTSALMIHTLNKDKEKVKICIETLIKYLDNIIAHPEEEKYHKIRINNKVFQERVSCLKGTEEFMQAVRFYLTTLPVDDHEEAFYLLDGEEAKNIERLENIKEVLRAAEPIKPQLDRCLKVFHPSALASKFNIPNEFYSISPEDLKKEQQRRTEAVEKLGMLRTKAMRERDEQRELRKYRYTLLRVKFSDGVVLQGTFRAMEKLSELFNYIRENLANEWMPFELMTATGQKLTEESLSLAELGLVPAAIVNFAWDPTIVKEVTAQQGASQLGTFLKLDILALIQTL